VALAKLSALAAGARRVRRELAQADGDDG
jgi:hypothetical protein